VKKNFANLYTVRAFKETRELRLIEETEHRGAVLPLTSKEIPFVLHPGFE